MESAAACHTADKVQQNMTATGLKLASGDVIPIVLGACDRFSDTTLENKLRVTQGYLGTVKVNVLRDSGCSSAAVRGDLVKPEQMTGKVCICKLFDSSLRQYPMARIEVDTPYYVGKLEAMVVKKP